MQREMIFLKCYSTKSFLVGNLSGEDIPHNCLSSSTGQPRVKALRMCEAARGAGVVSFPEPANFLQRMLDENEGSGKDQF